MLQGVGMQPHMCWKLSSCGAMFSPVSAKHAHDQEAGTFSPFQHRAARDECFRTCQFCSAVDPRSEALC